MTHSPLALISQKYGFSEQEFRKTIIKTCISHNFSDEEFAAFISVANTYGLNPLTKEIYALPKRGGGIIPVVSIDGWIKIIKSNPQFDGMTFQDQLDKNGQLIAIKCAIRLKEIKDPIEVTEYLNECKQKTDPWQKYPARMLRHKAVIQCARYAFGFSGIYDEDEAERINQGSHSQRQLVSDEMIMEIQGLMHETQTDETKVLSFANVKNITDLSLQEGQIVLQLLQKKREKQPPQEQQPVEIVYDYDDIYSQDRVHPPEQRVV
ncbi:phage recombination protein Bet [Bartonella sp. AR 15-3]|uniref:phage recombination protein Bet n=1 Tax=Bartonella sp. AR 15-3 TaxID=545617 RepID=UPI0009994F53|nr:phage recombination protein Bet [Bartonella sp. AR 15-3]OPB31430.1 phage recombination protein Bet [Bartonella sp. AR 15-3]OPB31539.1 phage recombination protein Bet [Bartonella sp. AR 15-3]